MNQLFWWFKTRFEYRGAAFSGLRVLFPRDAQSTASTASPTPQGEARRGKRGTPTETQKATARDKQDELDDALGDLNRSTNRLRRKFDPLDKWLETRPQVEAMLDDARKINQALTNEWPHN